MYLQPTSTYYVGTEMHIRRNLFLILCQPPGSMRGFNQMTQTRAIVRKVAMSQCGHFMMGYAYAFGHKLILSGSYGSDGLPKTVPQEVYDRAFPVPEWLMELWAKGGGHNGAGSEKWRMADWAMSNLSALWLNKHPKMEVK